MTAKDAVEARMVAKRPRPVEAVKEPTVKDEDEAPMEIEVTEDEDE